MKILSCSDVHLDTFQAFSKPVDNMVSNSRLENSLKALDMFFAYGKNNSVKIYVINGDLFNQRLKINPGMYSYSMQRLIRAFHNTPKGSTLYLNVGNHDEQSRYINPNSVSIIKSFNTNDYTIKVADSSCAVTFDLGESNILMIPFTEDIEKSKSEIKNALNNLNKPTTVFAHLGVENSVSGRWSHKLGGAYNLSDIGWDNKYVVSIHLGHYHLGQTLKEEVKGYKKAFYEGNLIPINFNDVQEDGLGLSKGFWISDSNTGETHFKAVTDVLPTFNIISLKSFKSSLSKLSELTNNNYVRVIVSDDKEYEKVKSVVNLSNTEIQIKKEIKEVNELGIDSSFSDEQIIKKYFNKYYKGNKRLLNKALKIIESLN